MALRSIEITIVENGAIISYRREPTKKEKEKDMFVEPEKIVVEGKTPKILQAVADVMDKG